MDMWKHQNWNLCVMDILQYVMSMDKEQGLSNITSNSTFFVSRRAKDVHRRYVVSVSCSEYGQQKNF